ncbi:MAG: glycosyltransferase family 4 protein, partial [Gammaproteobacteria bacterium]|nr:glycosyltransferase family 4 protein [Gammaproteobacteria bacterium]
MNDSESNELEAGMVFLKIVIIAGFSPSIINFRKDLIIAFLKHAEVTVFAPRHDDETEKMITDLGVNYQRILLKPQSINPFQELKTRRDLIKLLKMYSPDVVFSYTVKPVIWGSLAAKKTGVKKIYSMVEGLGYAFTDMHSLKRLLIKKIEIWLYRKALACNDAVFFLNPDDGEFFRALKIFPLNAKSIILNGIGVDLSYYKYSISRVKPIRFLLIARLLIDKGIVEYVNAAKFIKEKYPVVEFHLVGYVDNNPAAIPQSILDRWIREKSVIFHGKLADVRPVIREASVYVLPSFYREGMPRSILEAMSMGRAIITTDAAGCRETVIDGCNGFLIPVKNVDALVAAMTKMIENPELIKTMGVASRQLAEKKYDVHQVNRV